MRGLVYKKAGSGARSPVSHGTTWREDEARSKPTNIKLQSFQVYGDGQSGLARWGETAADVAYLRTGCPVNERATPRGVSSVFVGLEAYSTTPCPGRNRW